MASPKFSTIVLFALLSVLALASNTEAFVPSKSVSSRTPFTTAPVVEDISSTQLSERQWNFNEGQSPWGMKINAETWNGRVAQIAFVWIFLQELVTGKGVLQGIDEGNWFFLLNEGLFAVGVVGLTVWLAIKGDDDYTKA
uniref:Uncharacterized protein n=1 Tax=Pseudo-nitzschia delicatissima TaxID=44447 RepID=A0A7S0UNQ6_9STRA|mmetsp:Transcript_4379/g.9129  ORF Transcript_4379/g.9129 Transcript_4379/m.9129 type:complete len:140 (+) Transcript_4379:99-518(+)